jgi:hypothetical protein
VPLDLDVFVWLVGHDASRGSVACRKNSSRRC